MMQFCQDLFPINRSLLGEGNLITLKYIAGILPSMRIASFPTGFSAYDWVVPEEWEVLDAYISDMEGNHIIDFSTNNLHVVGYSIAVDEVIHFKELKNYLFVHEKSRDAIPYLTTYYNRTWGFCLSKNQLEQFDEESQYHVVINSRHFSGELFSGEVYLPGESKKEILFSTYICHPSMANNELSGPAVLTSLTTWLMALENRHFSYRISFHSETLGALCFIKANQELLRDNVIAAWNFTCMGGPDSITVLPSQYANSTSDKVTKMALKKLGIKPKFKDFLTRGSDERQFSSPRLGIPMVSIMKSPYGEYDEYHTSLDNMKFISEASMTESLYVMKEIVLTLEREKFMRQSFIGEAQLNKYGLYPKLTESHHEFSSRDFLNVMQFCDGKNTVNDIARLTRLSIDDVHELMAVLSENNLIE